MTKQPQVKVSCDFCGQSYRVANDKLGQKIQCLKCHQEFVLTLPVAVHNPDKTNPEKEVSEWHLAIGKASQGPFTASQVVALIRQGKATAKTLVWKQGMDDWQPASAFPELGGVTPTRPTPPVPPLRAGVTASNAADPSPEAPIATKQAKGRLKGFFAGIKDAVSHAAQQAQERMACNACGTRMNIYEQSAKMGKCAKCLLAEAGLVSDPDEGFVFSQAATYQGGLPDHVQPGKRNGFAFVYVDRLIFFDDAIRWSVSFNRVVRAELDTFQIGGARAVLAGINAVALKQVRNTLTVTFLDQNGVEQTTRFQIHGAATIPGEEVKAREFLSHLNRFKSQFSLGQTVGSSPGGETIEARLEKLDRMREKGLIREAEYEKKRAELIALL